MGMTAHPPFQAMSLEELEQARTALEVKLGPVDYESRGWILGFFDELINRVAGRTGTDASEPS
jgi:hypothetical protein